MICLLLLLILALAIVATVVLFLVSGKCPGGVQSAPLSAYEKAMVKYATLQELKALKRLAADEKEAEAYELVHSINTANSTWTARFNKAAVGMDVQKQLSDKMNENSKISTGIYYTLSDIFNVVRINGVCFVITSIHTTFHQKYVKHLEKLYAIIMDGIPNRFDARDKWPECEIGRVYDQGGCGSCWAIAASTVASDRYCISSRGQNFRFSAQKLIECCPYCGGCNGSESHERSVEPLLPFYYYYESGLVSEVAQDCGYPCKLETYFKPKGVKNCSQTCVNGRTERRKYADYVYRIGTVNGTSSSIMNSLARTYEMLRQKNGWREVDDLTLAKAELMQFGPFTTCFHVFSGFLHFFDGSYTHLKDIDKLHVYDHCVKTIGWDGDHIIAVNSWSKNWAKDGTFKLDIQMLAESRGDMYSAMVNLDY
ncbi:Pept-C1 domain-containing protein [Aphelenchoides besseyi]|nr:Pept-C1 domain-containing protein [Aphelenchoides besseyi]